MSSQDEKRQQKKPPPKRTTIMLEKDTVQVLKTYQEIIEKKEGKKRVGMNTVIEKLLENNPIPA
jgi:hypothetical protein